MRAVRWLNAKFTPAQARQMMGVSENGFLADALDRYKRQLAEHKQKVVLFSESLDELLSLGTLLRVWLWQCIVLSQPCRAALRCADTETPRAAIPLLTELVPPATLADLVMQLHDRVLSQQKRIQELTRPNPLPPPASSAAAHDHKSASASSSSSSSSAATSCSSAAAAASIPPQQIGAAVENELTRSKRKLEPPLSSDSGSGSAASTRAGAEEDEASPKRQRTTTHSTASINASSTSASASAASSDSAPQPL
jgi:hypothetical protein